MWVFVFYDLPMDSKRNRKIASKFRTDLLKDGFQMFQFSIYIRPCFSIEKARVHIKRTKRNLPEKGSVAILKITDKQFGLMEFFQGKKEEKRRDTGLLSLLDI